MDTRKSYKEREQRGKYSLGVHDGQGKMDTAKYQEMERAIIWPPLSHKEEQSLYWLAMGIGGESHLIAPTMDLLFDASAHSLHLRFVGAGYGLVVG